MENSKTSSSSPMKRAGRPRVSSPLDSNSLFRFWLDNTALPQTGMINSVIAERLGYARPHIVSMWRAGKARVPLAKIPALAELFNADIGFLHFLWSEQETRTDPALAPIENLLFQSLSESNRDAVLKIRSMT